MKHFDSMQDGFAYVREKNAPTTVLIEGAAYHLFPSGRAERRFAICPVCTADLNESIPIDASGTCPGCGIYWGRL